MTDVANVWPSSEAGGHLVVCVSGLGGAEAEWASVGPALTRFGDVIAVELLVAAAGASQGGGPLQGTHEAIDRVLADAPGGSVLIGHSMGALASMLIAASESRRLGGLVLTAPFVPIARHGRSRFITAADYARHRVLFLAGARRRHQRPKPRTVNRRSRAVGLGALARYGLRPAAFHVMADRVRCPVLIVHGDHDHYVPPAFALAAAARHPSWQVALIAEAGHFPHRDNAAAWLTTVDPWLQRLRQR
jgi:pimeloyl-ACP methyl ester carboxylesterase